MPVDILVVNNWLGFSLWLLSQTSNDFLRVLVIIMELHYKLRLFLIRTDLVNWINNDGIRNTVVFSALEHHSKKSPSQIWFQKSLRVKFWSWYRHSVLFLLCLSNLGCLKWVYSLVWWVQKISVQMRFWMKLIINICIYLRENFHG